MSEEEVLTEEESDALLEQSADSQPAAAGGVQEPDDGFWEQVSLDRIPALETLNAGIADALAQVWREMFSREIIVSPQVPCRTDGRRLVGSISFEESVRSFDLNPLGAPCLLITQPDTVSAMVDLCFGGPGSGARSEKLAALTEMERRLFSRFGESVRDSLNAVLRTNGQISLHDTEQAFDISTHPLCEPGARAVSCRFVFDIGQEQHTLEIVWPGELIELLNQSAPKSLPAAGDAGEMDWSGSIKEQIKGASIELRAVIGGISIRLHEISSAKEGDIIMTSEVDKVCLYAGSQPVFEGTLGAHEGFNAVKINKPYVNKRFGDT